MNLIILALPILIATEAFASPFAKRISNRSKVQPQKSVKPETHAAISNRAADLRYSSPVREDQRFKSQVYVPSTSPNYKYYTGRGVGYAYKY